MPNESERTLLTSLILSSLGPLVLGTALFFGQSSTQIADFIRRSAELMAIIVSWLIFRTIHKKEKPDLLQKIRLEKVAKLCIGSAMILSAVAMLFVAFLSINITQGSVLPSLTIAILGVITNSWFWLRYRQLSQVNPDIILLAQKRLFGAKTMVDLSVVLSLSYIAIAPNSPAVSYVDSAGSVIVALYLLISGIKTVQSRQQLPRE